MGQKQSTQKQTKHKKQTVPKVSFLNRQHQRYLESDYFSQPIQLNFKGMKQFYSMTGAFVSMVVRIGVLIFATTRALSVISQQSTEIYSTVSVLDPTQKISFADFNQFDFMIGFNTVLTAEMASIVVTMDQYNNGGTLIQSTPIEIDICQDTHAGIQQSNQEFGLTIFTEYTLFCPNQGQNMQLMGDHLQSRYYQINAVVVKCTPTLYLDCVNDASFNQFIKQSVLTLWMPRNQIMLKDISTQPLSQDFIKVFEQHIDLNFIQNFRVKLQVSAAQLFDSIAMNVLQASSSFSFLSYLEYETIERQLMPDWIPSGQMNSLGVYYTITGAGQALCKITLELDNKMITYFRKQTAAWEIMAYAGGFAVALMFIAQIAFDLLSMNSSARLNQAYMLSQYQTRTRDTKRQTKEATQEVKEVNKDKDQESSDDGAKEEKKEEKEKSAMMEEDDKDSQGSNMTQAKIEKQIESQGLIPIVEDICSRQRYKAVFQSTLKRYISCFDSQKDEQLKKMRYLAEKKLQNELDVTRLIRKIRNFEALSHYLLTERQRYLLKFNQRHVIDSDSDLISVDSAESMFSVPSDEEDRNLSIRQRVMVKLIAEDDFRDEQCALKLINKELEQGVTKVFNNEASEKSSIFEKSDSSIDISEEQAVEAEEFQQRAQSHRLDSSMQPLSMLPPVLGKKNRQPIIDE